VKSRLLAWNPQPAKGTISDSGSPLGMTTPPASDFADNWNVFVRGNVILGQQFSQPEIEHNDYTTSAFELGSDYQLSDHFLVGVLFDYNHTDTSLDNQGSSATIDSYSPGLFASYADGGFFANALATYGWNSYTTERHVHFGSFDETASGAPTGNETLGNLDGGYEFHSHHWTFGPTAGIQYVHLNVDPFTEAGGCSSDLAVHNEAADSLRSRLGGRVSYAVLDHDNHVIFTPYLDASWQHEFLAGSRTITSSFSEFNAGPIVVSTPDTSRDSALVVVGLDADVTRSITAFTDYAIQAGGNDYFGQSIEAGMKIAF
jgi:outer membrane autotransporter protein